MRVFKTKPQYRYEQFARIAPKECIVIADDEEEAEFQTRCVVAGYGPTTIEVEEITTKEVFPLWRRNKK